MRHIVAGKAGREFSPRWQSRANGSGASHFGDCDFRSRCIGNRGIMRHMKDELERFVASLAIPADRKAVVLAELSDHVASAAEAAARDGVDPEAAGRAALGNLEALRRALEAVEPGFRVSRGHAFTRGALAS